MKIAEAKVRQKVVDTWYSNPHKPNCWGVGIIKKVLKTRVHIKFENVDEVMVFDKAHFNQFIKRKKDHKFIN